MGKDHKRIDTGLIPTGISIPMMKQNSSESGFSLEKRKKRKSQKGGFGRPNPPF
jgi:hypothetical protein